MLSLKSMKSIEIDAYRNCQLRILSLLEHTVGKNKIKILDIGCGDGRFSKEIAGRCNTDEIYGVEIDRALLAKARKNKIRVRRGNANQKLPFKDNQFDVVVANQLIEHLTDPDKLVREIRRVLKRKGYCIISTPNLASLHNRIFVLFGWQLTNIAPSTKLIFGNPSRGAKSMMWGPHRHLTVFSPAALKEMLEHYGLKVEKVAGSGFHPLKSAAAVSLSKLFPRMSVFLIVKARK